MSLAAKVCFELWIKLDELWTQGLGESEAADVLRDEMDAPWYAMTASEMEEVKLAIRDRERQTQ